MAEPPARPGIVGFGDTYDDQRSAMLSTRAGDGLHVRTANATTAEDTAVNGVAAGSPHRDRIV